VGTAVVRDLDYAADFYIGELARQGRTKATRTKYQQVLFPFVARNVGKAPGEVSADDCRRYLDNWVDCAPATIALYVSIMNAFFIFCERQGMIAPGANPMATIKRPPLKRPEELDVVTVSDEDVRKMHQAIEAWDEMICVALLTCLGPRRNAAAMARRSDVDFERGMIRLHEKGGKVITKPMPDELLAVLRAADENGIWKQQGDYLIPNRGATWRKRGGRSNKVVYAIVKRLAARAGVEAHPHALRAAFAVRFDQQISDVMALKDLLGHTRLETTQVYLRRRDRARGMEKVRALRWGAASVFPPDALDAPDGIRTRVRGERLSEPLRRKLDELKDSKREFAR
jgi:integrase/recombinase XerC